MHEVQRFLGNLDCASPAITLTTVWAGYNREPVLRGIDLCVPKGSLVGVIGPNGGGKSTLLKVILGLLRPWRGAVNVLGQTPTKMRRQIGYVPQREDVDWRFPVNAFDVVLMGTFGRIGLLRRPGQHEKQLAMHCLERVGLANLAHRQIGELSGGQQQRVFIARALAQEPSILLLDEPVAGIDASSQHAIFELLETLCAEGVTVLVTSHDLSCVASRFERVLCLNQRLVAYGSPEQVLNPEILSETYESHLLAVRAGETAYVIDAGILNR